MRLAMACRADIRSRAARGFSLTELAVVLAIVGLLLAGLLLPLGTQVEQRQIADTTRRLEDAREALIGFAVINGRLPCPASLDSLGIESPAGGTCTDWYTGFLPAVTLGFSPVDGNGYAIDAWGNRIRYAVSQTTAPVGTPPHFTDSIKLKANGIGTKPDDIVICAGWGGSTSNCGTAAQITNMSPTNRVVAAVIWSQGKNFASVGAGGVDESANNKTRLPAVANNHPIFVSHEPRPAGAPGGEFDDILIWLPVGALYGRLISAGVLP